ncbi:MAG: hypothetical protein Greene041636_941, partial [Parcubacteria group bacterium Greene0416_36]
MVGVDTKGWRKQKKNLPFKSKVLICFFYPFFCKNFSL